MSRYVNPRLAPLVSAPLIVVGSTRVPSTSPAYTSRGRQEPRRDGEPPPVAESAFPPTARALSAGWSECFDRSARVVDREPLRVPRRGRTIARTRTARRGDRDVRDVRKSCEGTRAYLPLVPSPLPRATHRARAPYTPRPRICLTEIASPDPAPAGRGRRRGQRRPHRRLRQRRVRRRV